MRYMCPKCGNKFDQLPKEGGIRCPYCGNRIILKTRPPVVKVVIAK